MRVSHIVPVPRPPRVKLLRALMTVLCAGVMVLASLADASARRHRSHSGGYSPPRSAVVVDGYTDKILHSSAASEPRYPASLTKVMTLYLTFEAMRAGRITPATEMTVSAHAAAQDPTKLDLEEGEKITVRDAMRGLVTKSANDAAVVLAEHLGGSEEAFAKQMTAKARQLGMQNTTFRNASGLPNAEQRSTAHDLSVLARRILKDFPEQASIFQTRYFNYRGNIYRNHNSLLFNYVGAEGMKTGFTQASGFNVIATARRNGKFLIGVVMGGRSARSRDENMRSLLNANWARAGLKPAKPVEVAAAPKPAPASKPLPVAAPLPAPERPVAAPAPAAESKPLPVAAIKPAPAPEKPVAAPVLIPAAAPAQAPKPPQVMLASIAPSLPPERPAPAFVPVAVTPDTGPVSAALPESEAILSPAPPAVEVIRRGKGPQLRPAPAGEVAAPEAPAAPEPQQIASNAAASVAVPSASMLAPVQMTGKRYHVQVGAYATEESAQLRLAAVLKDAGDILGSHPQLLEAGKSGKNNVVRVRFDGFSEKGAAITCEALKKRAIDCLTGRAE